MGAGLWPLQEYIPPANVPGATPAVLDQDVSKCVVEAHQQTRNYEGPRRRRLRLVRGGRSGPGERFREARTHSDTFSARIG